MEQSLIVSLMSRSRAGFGSYPSLLLLENGLIVTMTMGG